MSRVILTEFVVAEEPKGRFTINYPLSLKPDGVTYARSRGYRPLYIVRAVLKPEFVRRVET